VSVLNYEHADNQETVWSIIEHAGKIATVVNDSLVFKNKKINTHDKESRIKLGNKYPSIFLTEREAHCALLTVLGYTSKEIGQTMHLSDRTVQYYLHLTRQKLSTNSRAQMVKMLLSSDFLDNLKKQMSK
jgi:DNA-binding CsgD family transcriptional regulator